MSEQLPTVKKIALSAQGSTSLLELNDLPDCVAIFGNEARGIDALIDSDVMQVSIPMTGNAESLNLAAAAAIVIFHLSHK
jgi:TrmH family RNA methyltransferase